MKHFRTNIPLLLVVTFCYNLIIPCLVLAAEPEPTPTMQVAPIIEEMSLDPSSETNKSITVTNQGTNKLGIKVYVAPYSIIKETGSSDFETQSETTQIYRWIKIQDQNSTYQDKAEFFIEPGKVKTINYQIKVPESAPGGSQHACIFVETIPGDSDDADSNSIITVSRAAVKIFADVSGETIQDAEITKLDASTIIVGGKASTNATVKNIGNIDIKPTLTLKLSSLGGDTVYSDTKVAMIFPEHSDEIKVDWPETPTFGIYRLTTAVNVLGKQKIVEKIIFIFPVWFIVLFMILVIVCAILSVRRKRKRRPNKKGAPQDIVIDLGGNDGKLG